MHLARVTTGTSGHAVGHAAPSNGAADPLAVLLGGEGGLEAAAFPATLQAALADSETADEALDVVEGEAGDDAAGGQDEAGTGLDAALAVALALGVVAPVPVPTAAGTAPIVENAAGEDGTAVVADGAAPGGTAGAIVAAATEVANAANGAVVTGKAAGTTNAPAVAADTLLVAADAPVDAADAPVDAADAPIDAADAPIDAADADTAAGPQVVEAADGTASGAARARPAPQALPVEAGSDPALTRPSVAAAASTTTPTAGPARAGATPDAPHGARNGADASASTFSAGAAAAATAPFSSGGGAQQHGLDLGTSDRQQAFAPVEGPAGVLTTTTTAPAPSGETQHATTIAPGGGATSDGVSGVSTTSAAATGTGHDTPVPRAERATNHPGGIEARWGERVADALRLSSVRGGGEIRLQLEPEGLGHIDVRLHLQPDGVRAVIVAEHESTRALLTSQQHVLQDAFTRSDLRLSGFSVDVGSGGGTATFGRDGDSDRGGSAPPAPSAPVSAASATDTSESTAAPVANGRVNVRV